METNMVWISAVAQKKEKQCKAFFFPKELCYSDEQIEEFLRQRYTVRKITILFSDGTASKAPSASVVFYDGMTKEVKFSSPDAFVQTFFDYLEPMGPPMHHTDQMSCRIAYVFE